MGEVNIAKLKEGLCDVYNSILDIIYPYKEECIICKEVEVIGICKICENKIKRIKEQDKIIAYGTYGNTLKALILEMKYRKNFIAIEILASFLVRLINEEGLIADMILYVPMTKKSKNKRGFNQCELLAKKVSKITGIEAKDYLYKNKDTKEQKILNKEERKENVRNVFNLKNKDLVKDKIIILIDDVVTTGATVYECEKILKKYGAKEIKILTISKSDI